MVTKAYLDTPARPHVVVATDGLAVAHEAKVHGRADEVAVECQVHATHWKQSALWYGQNRINIPKQNTTHVRITNNRNSRKA